MTIGLVAVFVQITN